MLSAYFRAGSNMTDQIADANPVWLRLIEMIDGLPQFVASSIWYFALFLLFLAMVAAFLILADVILYRLTGKRGIVSIGFLRLASKSPLIGRGIRRVLTRLSEPPKKPLTTKQRVIMIGGLVLYLLAFLGFTWVEYSPNTVVRGFDTSSGGILVEISARRQPTDGFGFHVQFDQPAQVRGIWADSPAPVNGQMGFQARFEEVVNLQDEQVNDGMVHSIVACYPFATLKRSVFVYFIPVNQANSQQLQLTSMRRNEGQIEQLCTPRGT